MLVPLLYLLYPFVWAVNLVANGFIRLFMRKPDRSHDALNQDELRTVVQEAGSLIPKRHQSMLLGPRKNMDDIANAIQKVHDNRDKLA